MSLRRTAENCTLCVFRLFVLHSASIAYVYTRIKKISLDCARNPFIVSCPFSRLRMFVKGIILSNTTCYKQYLLKDGINLYMKYEIFFVNVIFAFTVGGGQAHPLSKAKWYSHKHDPLH